MVWQKELAISVPNVETVSDSCLIFQWNSFNIGQILNSVCFVWWCSFRGSAQTWGKTCWTGEVQAELAVMNARASKVETFLTWVTPFRHGWTRQYDHKKAICRGISYWNHVFHRGFPGSHLCLPKRYLIFNPITSNDELKRSKLVSNYMYEQFADTYSILYKPEKPLWWKMLFGNGTHVFF